MKSRLFAFAAFIATLANVSGLAFSGTTREAGARQTNALVAMLPASDGVVLLDSRRFFDDALPRIMSANQPMLSSVIAKLAEIETKTGIDLRKFDQVAVGVSARQVAAKDFDWDTVAVARGTMGAGGLIGVVKLTANGSYREEKIGTNTVYVFKAKDVANGGAAAAGTKVPDYINKALDGLTREVAVTAMDQKTIVFGSLSRVRETLEGKSKISTDVTNLLPANESAIAAFAFKNPGGMAGLLPIDNDELGLSVESIRYAAGSLDVGASGSTLKVMARTAKPDQAQALLETLEGLQILGKAFLGGSKRADQKVYGRMVQNAKIAKNGSDLTFELLVPQSDIDILIAGTR